MAPEAHATLQNNAASENEFGGIMNENMDSETALELQRRLIKISKGDLVEKSTLQDWLSIFISMVLLLLLLVWSLT